MGKKIAMLLGLVGLAGLLCLVAALTSGCGLPVTKGGFDQRLAHGIGPVWGRLDALDRKVVAIEESTAANFAVVDANFQTLAAGVEQATKRAEAAKSLGETTVKLLGPIGRDTATASKEATAGRKAIVEVGRKVDSAKVEAATAHAALDQKVDRRADEVVGAVADVGRKVDSMKAEATTAHTALDQKIDRRADELVGVVAGVDRKVDSAAADAKTAHIVLDQKVENVKTMTRDEVIKLLDDLLKKHP